MLFSAKVCFRRKKMENKKILGMRRRALLIMVLVAIGIAVGSGYLYTTNMNETKDILVLEFVNGRIILNAEDRELLKQQVINVTLEDNRIKELIAGKNFTTYVTLAKSIRAIEEITVDDSSRRIFVEFDYVALVTLIFEDGSGYKIPVNWEEWTVGEPEYSEQIAPPDSTIR
jgi:hypothetical protein